MNVQYRLYLECSFGCVPVRCIVQYASQVHAVRTVTTYRARDDVARDWEKLTIIAESPQNTNLLVACPIITTHEITQQYHEHHALRYY